MSNITTDAGIIVPNNVNQNPEADPTAPAMIAAEAQIDAARASIAALAARLADAAAVNAAKTQARRSLVELVATGGIPTVAALRKADAELADAQAAEAVIRDAASVPNSALTDGLAALKAAKQAQAEHRLAVAIGARLDAAGNLDRIGAEYNEAADVFLATGDVVEKAMNAVGKSVPPHQVMALRELRLIRSPLSPKVQNAVLRSSTIVHGQVAGEQRNALTGRY
jgi:hypothetical protein